MHRPQNQNGSALVYILIAIALVAALTATFMNNSGQQTTSQRTFSNVTELNSQINLIRSAIQECVLTYPAGDKTAAYAALTAQNRPYPLEPDSAYLASPAASGDLQVSYLGCPGNPGNSNDHAKIFGSATGKFLPPPPKLFTQWFYANSPDGVWIIIGTDKADSFIKSALQKLDDQFTECEADVVDATGGTVNMSSTSDPRYYCLGGYTCFRVFLVAKPTAVYNGDADGDEAACP